MCVEGWSGGWEGREFCYKNNQFSSSLEIPTVCGGSDAGGARPVYLYSHADCFVKGTDVQILRIPSRFLMMLRGEDGSIRRVSRLRSRVKVMGGTAGKRRMREAAFVFCLRESSMTLAARSRRQHVLTRARNVTEQKQDAKIKKDAGWRS